MDLEFTQSKVGKTILKQKLGCPIGGMLSSFYANVFCGMRENQYIQSASLNRYKRIYGIRQIDDLVIWISYEQYNKESKKEAQALLAKVYHSSYGEAGSGVYNGGLTVKPEDFRLRRLQFTHNFAGTIITGKLNATKFACTTLNKNWNMIKKKGRQKVHRFMRPYSYTHERIKNNLPMGSLMRISCQNTYINDAADSMLKNLIEMNIIGYSKDFLCIAVKKLRRKQEWTAVANCLLLAIKNKGFPGKYISRLL